MISQLQLLKNMHTDIALRNDLGKITSDLQKVKDLGIRINEETEKLTTKMDQMKVDIDSMEVDIQNNYKSSKDKLIQKTFD